MERLIFHIDVNSAFLSWEATRRVAKGEADLRLIPSAIGGDREKRRGVILAKSIPAKQFGVTTGEPVAMALLKCPNLYLAKPDFRLYEECSQAFLQNCRFYAPVVDRYSIDECFLDMTGTGRLYPDPVAIAHTIKDEIRDTLGFTVNVGVGSNKLLAKMASDFEKPDRVHTLFSHEIEEKLWPLPVRDLFSVGHSTAEKLQALNLHTIGELARVSEAHLQGIVGEKFGSQLYRFARGIDDSPVETEVREAKGYSNSITLDHDVTNREEAHRILLALTDSVATRMRMDGAKTECVAVTIRSSEFCDSSRQIKLNEPTDITSELFRHAGRAFDLLWNGRMPLRLLGVSLNQVSKEGTVQLTLFENDNRERARKVDRVVDSIRERFGSDVIVRGTTYRSDLDIGKKHRAQIEKGSPVPKK